MPRAVLDSRGALGRAYAEVTREMTAAIRAAGQELVDGGLRRRSSALDQLAAEPPALGGHRRGACARVAAPRVVRSWHSRRLRRAQRYARDITAHDPLAVRGQAQARRRLPPGRRRARPRRRHARRRSATCIRASGLLKLSVPTTSVASAAAWPILLRIVREIASADASLAHLFGYHHLGVVTPHLIGTPEQRDCWYAETARGNLFWGNCLNPLDPRTTLSRTADASIRLNGEKSFCTGAADSDLMLVSATWPGESRLQVAVLPSTVATASSSTTTGTTWASARPTAAAFRSTTWRAARTSCSDRPAPAAACGPRCGRA